jgi:uncharacterized phiE125 gp8 family phage protein
MMLIEQTQILDASFPVSDFRNHLRLGTGFADDDLQDAVLVSFLRAAVSAIEGRISKALFLRDFSLQLSRWSQPDCQSLPIAPVVNLTGAKLVARDGSESAIELTTLRLVPNGQEPSVISLGSALPTIGTGGYGELNFTAGYGLSWTFIPADLRQAVFLLAAHYYEYRSETALSEGCMPFGVTSLIERYRPLRIGLRGAKL